MKILALLGLLAILTGCEEDPEQYRWVVDRSGNQPAEIQRRLNVMGRYEFRYDPDDDLEKSGHYVYFYRYMRPSAAAGVLKAVKDEMDAVPATRN